MMSGENQGFGELTNETIIIGLETKALMNYIITGHVHFLMIANMARTARAIKTHSCAIKTLFNHG